MDHQEIIKQLKFEYYGAYEAAQKDDEAHGTNYAAHFMTLYEFLLKRGYTRHQLSALGISKEVAW